MKTRMIDGQRRASKKGQVTFFIIFGLVILVVFGFLYYLGNNVKPISKGDDIAKIRLQGEPIKIYVESCIKDSVNRVLPKFLSQGGRIYSDEESSILPCTSSTCTAPGFINYDSIDVSYLLSSNIIGDDVGNQLLSVPDYPCNSTSCMFHSIVDRPCSYDPLLNCPLPIDPPLFRTRLLTFTEGQYSWEKQLKSKISTEINNCIDFNESEWYPYNVEEGNASVEFVFTTETTNVHAEVPLTLSHPSLAPELVVHKYDLSFNYRILSFYNFVKSLLYSESTQTNFDISSNYTSLAQYLSGFHVEVVYDVKDKDDVVIVTDSNSDLDLNFARQNIPPVLDYYDNSSHPTYNVEAPIQSFVRISPIAYDPNEDNIVYTYEGWKQDYREHGLSDGSYEHLPIGVGDRWMDSEIYRQTGREAEVYLNLSDAGVHEFVVRVSDGELSDYQIVKIHVSVPGIGGG